MTKIISLKEFRANHLKCWKTFRTYVRMKYQTPLEMLEDLARRNFWIDDRNLLNSNLEDNSDHIYCDADQEWLPR
jgi:hypothetical protein